MKYDTLFASTCKAGILLLLFSFFIFSSSILNAQTTVPTGPISGTWQKSGSPYKINGNVYVPVGQKLTITEGVTIEFQDTWKMDVYGKMAILGKPNDTVLFTAKNKTNGWRGVKVYGQNATDTLRVWYVKFEYFKTQEQYYLKSRAVLKIDSIKGLVQIMGARFTNNHGIANVGLNINTSNLWMKNCHFDHNLASDLRTTSAGPGFGSAAVLRNSFLDVDSIYSHHNNNASAYFAQDSTFSFGSRGCFVVWDCNGDIKNSSFHNNYAAALGAGIYFASTGLQKYVMNIVNCNIYNNSGKATGAAVNADINNSTSSDKIIFKNCIFSGNSIVNWRNKNTITTEASDLGAFKATGQIVLNNCTFMKNNAGVSVYAANSSMDFNNCSIVQNSGMGIFMSQGAVVNINNSIIANNGMGIWTISATPILTNSIIANNYPEPSLLQRYLGAGYGVFLDFGGGIELRNSIISGHRDSVGRFTNVYVFGSNISGKHCIIEGDYDSFKYDYRITPAKPVTWVNILNADPLWVNPTPGAGITYDALAADWHIQNNCSPISPALDGGTSSLGIHLLPTLDMEGNPRKVGDAPDIGPYEIQKPNKYTRILTEPRDTAFCANAGPVTVFNHNDLGNNIGYQWQKSLSQTGPYADINGANAAQLTASISMGSVTEWYRVIVKNTVCNNSDTSKAVQLVVNGLPNPNLGSDTTLANNGSKQLNAGAFANYQWYNGASTATLTVDKTNLDTGKNTIWVEVTDSKGCKGRDTAVITLEPINGLQNPSLAGVRIYPIPATNSLNIEMPTGNGLRSNKLSYTISSTEGRMMQSGVLQNKSNVIDITALKPGAFILELNVNGERYGMRVLKN